MLLEEKKLKSYPGGSLSFLADCPLDFSSEFQTHVLSFLLDIALGHYKPN